MLTTYAILSVLFFAALIHSTAKAEFDLWLERDLADGYFRGL